MPVPADAAAAVIAEAEEAVRRAAERDERRLGSAARGARARRRRQAAAERREEQRPAGSRRRGTGLRAAAEKAREVLLVRDGNRSAVNESGNSSRPYRATNALPAAPGARPLATFMPSTSGFSAAAAAELHRGRPPGKQDALGAKFCSFSEKNIA